MSIDHNGVMHTSAGHALPELAVNPSMFLEKSIVIYGPSGTGKSVITKNVMKILSEKVDQILIVSPSEPTNRSYAGIVPSPCIHYRPYLADPKNPKKDDGVKGVLRFLEAIWDRQEMMAAIYSRANNPEILQRLFGRISNSDRREGLGHIEKINKLRSDMVDKVRKQYRSDMGRSDAKCKEINEKFKEMLVGIYRKYITQHYSSLIGSSDLDEDELYSLTYLEFNPRMLLVFDDCAAMLKAFFKKEVFRKLFYQNRHSYISLIICCQDDTDLDANLRKNAFISFFTAPIVASANFTRTSNNFPKPTIKMVNEILPDVFLEENRKLAYIREDPRRNHFYHIKFPYPKSFKFGSSALHELCSSIQSDGVSMDKDNPYYERFKL